MIVIERGIGSEPMVLRDGIRVEARNRGAMSLILLNGFWIRSALFRFGFR